MYSAMVGVPYRPCPRGEPQLCWCQNKYFTEMCNGPEAGSYLRLINFLCHSPLGLRVIRKKKVSLSSVFLSTLVTGPTRSLSLEFSDARVYEPEIRAYLETIAHLC